VARETEVSFLFGVHGHQPQGNFPWVVEKAFEKAYRPFVEVVRDHPLFSFSLHCTGPLWEWIERERPWFLDWVGEMVDRGQVEIQISGFYEPVLAAIPPDDRLGQIEMAREYVKKQWGVAPRGLWLTERVWEPQILPQLIDAGIGYVVVDDYHFLCAGKKEGELGGYYLTEEGGETLAIFPISERLRYLVPFRPVAHVMDYLDQCPGPGAILYDDAEKFGVWPGTYEWVYGRGWLGGFLEALEDTPWLRTCGFSEFIGAHPPQGRVYLPTASYFEMGEWSLPAPQAMEFKGLVEELKNRGEWERYRSYVRGGIWKNFLVKYPEANHMHKRMVWVSKRVVRAGEEAKKALYKAQCNDPYWHGIFGGVYLPHLRRSVYHYLLEAEGLARVDLEGSWMEDLDADGFKEVIMSNGECLAVIKPYQGASLVELSFRGDRVNITDTLARRFEHYHKGVSSNGGEGGTPSIHEQAKSPPSGEVIYDVMPRYSFLDRILGPQYSIGDWERDPGCARRLLAVQAYTIVGDRPFTWRWEGEEGWLEKGYRLHGKGMEVLYRWSFVDGFPLGVEVNLHLPWAREARVEVSGESMAATRIGDWGDVEGVKGIDPSLSSPVVLEVEGGARFWQVPFFTLSQSEGGFDRIYQGTGFMFIMEAQGERTFRLFQE